VQCNALVEIAQADGENDVKRFFEEYPTMMHKANVLKTRFLNGNPSPATFLIRNGLLDSVRFLNL